MEILEFCAEKLRAAEVDKFELYWEKSSSVGVEINDGKLDHLSRSTDQGISIRVLKDQRMGFSYTFDLSHEAMQRAIRTAVDISTLMPADPLNDLGKIDDEKDGFASMHYSVIENYDGAGLQVPLEQKIEMARELEADAKRHDSRIKRVRKAGFDEITGESILMDWHGDQLQHRQTLFAAELSCVAEDGSSAEMGYDGQYTCFFDQLLPKNIAQGAAKSALELLHATSAPTMACPAVFKNSVVGQLLGFLTSSFSAENIDKNFSLLIGKKGEKLFSEQITIIDDGLQPNGTSTAPFDGEGTPSKTTTLVENGKIQNYLYDCYYARKHKTRTTGNSRRGGIKSQPGVGPTNLYLKKGATPLEGLFASARNGIYITELMGMHTANPVTGEFSVGASGILIENGMLSRPVKGFAIAGNLVDLLGQVTEVGSNLKSWGSIAAPSFLVSKISVSGK